MARPAITTTSGTYHVRLASMRASWFPEVVRRVLADLPDDVDAIIDLTGIGSIDRFSARALREAAGDAARRRVSLAIATNDPEVRRALFLERIDRWASIATDMTGARRLLGLLEPF